MDIMVLKKKKKKKIMYESPCPVFYNTTIQHLAKQLDTSY